MAASALAYGSEKTRTFGYRRELPRLHPAAQARQERDLLIGQLTTAYGLGGRARRIPDEAERARKAVWRRISDALNRIDNASPALGRHLRHSVHTGVYCSYTPERDIRWDTGQPRPQVPARSST